MTKDEALQMCLEYIETDAHERKYVRHAIKEALAQPEQEPVAWVCYGSSDSEMHDIDFEQKDVDALLVGTMLYTTPPQPKEPEQEEYLSKAYRLANELRCHLAIAPAPQRTWVGLTDEEIWKAVSRIGTSDSDVNPYAKLADARAIEAKLKEKNSG